MFTRTNKSAIRSIRFSAMMLLVMLGMIVLPLVPQTSVSAQAASSQKATVDKYIFDLGDDAGSGSFNHIFKVSGVRYTETASTRPTFILTYQYFQGRKPVTTLGKATLYNKKRVNRICKVNSDGVLVVRKSAIKDPQATFQNLLRIAREKDIIQMQ